MNLPNMDLADFQMLAALTNAAAAAQQQQQAAAVSNKAAVQKCIFLIFKGSYFSEDIYGVRHISKLLHEISARELFYVKKKV